MPKSSFDVAYQNTNIPSKIVAGLERISEAFRVLLWDYAKEMGLSPIQIQLLIFIKYHDAELCNVSHLAQEFNMTKPTISDAIKALNNKAYIEKEYDELDKRRYSIGLTKLGQQVAMKAGQFTSPMQEMMSDLNESTQQQFFDTLNGIIYKMHQSNILTVQRTCYACRYYTKSRNQHFCKLLDKRLAKKEIRLDCPEFSEK